MSHESNFTSDIEPSWFKQAQDIYARTELPDKLLKNLYTGITRGQTAATYIGQAIAPIWPRDTEFTVATIGIGLETRYIHQPYEPYVLHARMKALNIPHRLICIDKNNATITALKNRRDIFFYQSDPTNTFEWSSWHKLLDDLHQSDREIHAASRELKFISSIKITEDPYQGGTADLLCSGFRQTPVPRSFHEKVKDGTIEFLEEDIIMMNSTVFSQTDLIVCSNVLIGLPETAQQAGLWNLTHRLKPGAQLLINDGEYQYIRSMRKDRGGWMDDDVLKDVFGVSTTILHEEPSFSYRDILLTKI